MNTYQEIKQIYIGAEFGDLTVIDDRLYEISTFESLEPELAAICRCNCPHKNIITVPIKKLISGEVICCKECEYKDPYGRRKDPRLYGIWTAMKSRCENPNNPAYKSYGAIGITVCKEWQIYENFRDWAMSHDYNTFAAYGECTIERIDPTKGYSPDNCRFISLSAQQMNKKSNMFVTTDGVSATITDFAKALGVTASLISARYGKYNKSIEESLFTIPNNKGGINKTMNAIYFIDNDGKPISQDIHEEIIKNGLL